MHVSPNVFAVRERERHTADRERDVGVRVRARQRVVALAVVRGAHSSGHTGSGTTMKEVPEAAMEFLMVLTVEP